jgi:hypothetical protein
MNKRTDYISVQVQEDGSIDIVVPASMAEDFKLMVKKGTDLAPNKHVEITDFADRILGRDKWVGPCMKQTIHGYPVYVNPFLDKEQAVLITKNISEEVISEVKKAYCDGHPETCNCSYHAG